MHATGAVDVVLTTSSDSATKTNGFTYSTTAVGQSAYGGTIACLNGGLNNLIAATADNSTSIEWGGWGINVPLAESIIDGATNTTNIVRCLTDGESGCVGGINISTYAAGICSIYEIDSQGNSPCERSVNTCYDDWFLPAGSNTTASGQLNCLYMNQATIGGFNNTAGYWSSTEDSFVEAWFQFFSNGTEIFSDKFSTQRVRCVRAFTP